MMDLQISIKEDFNDETELRNRSKTTTPSATLAGPRKGIEKKWPEPGRVLSTA
jgi:hypothetical protein